MTAKEEENAQARLAYKLASETEMVKELVNKPTLFARIRQLSPAWRTDLVARVDAELSRIAIEEIFK